MTALFSYFRGRIFSSSQYRTTRKQRGEAKRSRRTFADLRNVFGMQTYLITRLRDGNDVCLIRQTQKLHATTLNSSFTACVFTVAYLGGGSCGHALTRYTVKNGISNLYILLKSALKMQEMPFQRPKFQNISRGHATGPPYNCVVTMASPSIKSWRRHCVFTEAWRY